MSKKSEHQPISEIDALSGVETTGHEWDGIKELNNPLPRWWLWIFILSIVFAVGYWVVYPSWPWPGSFADRGATVGTFGWTQYQELAESQSEITARQAAYRARFDAADFEEIVATPELYNFALAGAEAVFKDNCAACHGTGAAGGEGYPNLNDDDWLWGGSHEEIYQTLLYGVRSDHDETRYSEMPAFGELLEESELRAVAEYVVGLRNGHSHVLSGGESEEILAFLPTGARLYAEQCSSCHGVRGRGDSEFGAPNLVDALWLHSSGDVSGIIRQMRVPRHGMMPNWDARLSESILRQLAVYVHALGGGE